MKNKSILILFSTLFILGMSMEIYGQLAPCKKNLLISFYNVENLFDTIHNPHKLDIEFTPEGRKNWTSKRYQDKIEKLSRVISSYDSSKLPDIVGLCEIENKNVVEDLTKSKALIKGKYQIVHHESPDIRGIDNALIYKTKGIKLISEQAYHVRMKENKRFKTRDVLYVKLYIKKAKDTLHIFVNHWPSRRGGEEKSRPKRAAAALVVKHLSDSLILHCNNPKILIMGDLNDEPTNIAVKDVLGAQPLDSLPADTILYNLCYGKKQEGLGSYHYWKTGEWNMIDNMIITGSLLNSDNGLIAKDKEVRIFKPSWVLHQDNKGVISPSKTYGKGYYGGYSDHLSIYTYLYYNCK